MLNYFRADVRRILADKSHVFSMMLPFVAFFALLYFPGRTQQVTSVSLVASATNIVDWLCMVIGLFEMIAVFSEDFKVKTMQVAIGLGISRTQVIFCKLLEVMFLIVLDCIMLILLLMVNTVIFSTGMPLVVFKDLFCVLLVKGIMCLAINTSITMAVLFVTQSTILAIFVNVCVGCDALGMLLTLGTMFGFDWIETLKLNRLSISHFMGLMHSRLVLGQFSVAGFVGMCAYFGAGLLATCKLFSKQELDF